MGMDVPTRKIYMDGCAARMVLASDISQKPVLPTVTPEMAKAGAETLKALYHVRLSWSGVATRVYEAMMAASAEASDENSQGTHR
jgi:hypothetical protein